MDGDHAGEIRERDVRARRAEVGHEQVARVGAEAQQPRRPPARRDADAVLGEEAVVEQRVDPLGQHGAAEAGCLCELGARRRAVRADVVEHRDDTVGLESDAGLRGHFGSECKDICCDRQDFS